MMESLLAKMREYLQMDTEIDFAEFTAYYQQLMDMMTANYDSMGKDDLCKAKFILMIVSTNSESRALRKGTAAKKYKKIKEKTSFWSEAINYRLLKEGMAQQEIDAELEKIGGEEKQA